MNNESVMVSVILPNYNHAAYLRQRIESILNQSYRNFELIILDDCSTDTSRDIIEQYRGSDHVSQIVYNEKNSGSTFIQWRRGFDLAKGKYICIAESDDYSDLDFLNKLVSLLEANENCSVAYCLSHLVDENNVILPSDWDDAKSPLGAVDIFDSCKILSGRMLFKNVIYNAGMAIFRKTVLSTIDDSFMKYNYCGDYLFWVKVIEQGNVIRLCEKLNYFRQHINKVSPASEAKGLAYKQGKYIVQYVMDHLNFTPLQRKVILGKYLKEISKSKKIVDEVTRADVKKDFIHFFDAKMSYIRIYAIDKIFNLSGLNIRKNKYL